MSEGVSELGGFNKSNRVTDERNVGGGRRGGTWEYNIGIDIGIRVMGLEKTSVWAWDNVLCGRGCWAGHTQRQLFSDGHDGRWILPFPSFPIFYHSFIHSSKTNRQTDSTVQTWAEIE